MRVGYARVSARDQKLEIQSQALEKYGCEEIFKEKVSGANKDRPELQRALERLKTGDLLVVWKLDRLGRSLNHLVSTIADLRSSGIEFVSLSENIDTTTSTGRLFFHIMAALAEFERELINERTEIGRAAAREKGETGGRPRKLKDKGLEMVLNLAKDPANKPEDICRMAKISIATFYRYKARVSA
jgi:DNA invertase Pin-like site-specific DNA recombinase